MTLDSPETLGKKIVQKFIDDLQPKQEIIQYVNGRLCATHREEFMNRRRKRRHHIRQEHNRAMRECRRHVRQERNRAMRERRRHVRQEHNRAMRDASEYIDEYEDMYESSNDTLYTNQRKAQFQADAYERLRNWRWLLFIPYYVVFGIIVFEGNTHFAFWLLYAMLPIRVDWLVETLKQVGGTTSGILFN
jgi:hypothetical protein